MPVHLLPTVVIYMIMETLKPDLDAIRACSLTTRSLRFIAQSVLGRHISVSDPDRVKECVRILNGSGFQHVRSLSLGITTKRVILEEYWKDYLEILKVFAQRRSLVRLWLLKVPFFFLQRRQKKMFKEAILGLSSSVNDLGLYGCHFSCYEEMVSLVRAFPHCSKLCIQDCVTGGLDFPQNLFADFPQHRLSIADLDLTASSASELLIDPSGFIEDAELDISWLKTLACDIGSTDGIRRVLSATSESPIRVLRFSSACSDGFQGTYISRFSTPFILDDLTVRCHHRIHNFDLISVAPGIVDHRAYVPSSGCRVLGIRAQGLSETPLLDPNQNHLSLPHAQGVQHLLLVPLCFHPLQPKPVPASGGCGRLSNT